MGLCAQNVLAGSWSDGQKAMAYRMTGGNLKEVRRYDSAIFGYEGISNTMDRQQPDEEVQEVWDSDPQESQAVSTGP